jgi:hypothetical protein
MVYHTQNYWVFGHFPSSGIVGTRKHDVSETDPEKVQKPSNSDFLWMLHTKYIGSYFGGE